MVFRRKNVFIFINIITEVNDTQPLACYCIFGNFRVTFISRFFSFPNNSRFLEFASDYLNNLNSYQKLCVFNISEKFEFAKQRIREY